MKTRLFRSLKRFLAFTRRLRFYPLPSRWMLFSKQLRLRLSLETLESRWVPAIITWKAAGGGAWTGGANWSGGVAPSSADDAVIPSQFSGVTITVSGGTALAKTVDSYAKIQVNGGVRCRSVRLPPTFPHCETDWL
jgi:hypothetical protein